MEKIKLLYQGDFVSIAGRIGYSEFFRKAVPVRFGIASHTNHTIGIHLAVFDAFSMDFPGSQYFISFGPMPDFFALYETIKILEKVRRADEESVMAAYFAVLHEREIEEWLKLSLLEGITFDDFESIIHSRPSVDILKIASKHAKHQPNPSQAYLTVRNQYIERVDRMRTS